MGFFKDFDSRMKTVIIEQENPTLRKKKPRSNKCCLLMVMLTPLVLIGLAMIALSAYNEMVALEKAEGHLIDETAVEEQQLQQEQQLLRKKKESAPATTKEFLVLTTDYGEIRITLRPDLSSGSVDYVHRLIENGTCRRCNFYRAEKPGILQGVMANMQDGITTNTVLGDCPAEFKDVPNKCPEWDKKCGCHGPVMTKGAVAWAAGQAGGPDFFIDNYPSPAKFWGTQHTNFGFIEDPSSFDVITKIFELPVSERGGMHTLNDVIHFDMRLE